MKTIKDLKDQQEWDDLQYSERTEIAINTLFMAGKINEELKMGCNEGNDGVIVELCSVEDDDREALTQGWLHIKDGVLFEANIYTSDESHWYISDRLWDDLYMLLEELVDWE